MLAVVEWLYLRLWAHVARYVFCACVLVQLLGMASLEGTRL
jgi:hypothetical protein